MALILSEKDLAQLYRTPAAMDGLLKLMEEALSGPKTAHIGSTSYCNGGVL